MPLRGSLLRLLTIAVAFTVLSIILVTVFNHARQKARAESPLQDIPAILWSPWIAAASARSHVNLAQIPNASRVRTFNS
jgi:hypothetical protein